MFRENQHDSNSNTSHFSSTTNLEQRDSSTLHEKSLHFVGLSEVETQAQEAPNARNQHNSNSNTSHNVSSTPNLDQRGSSTLHEESLPIFGLSYTFLQVGESSEAGKMPSTLSFQIEVDSPFLTTLKQNREPPKKKKPPKEKWEPPKEKWEPPKEKWEPPKEKKEPPKEKKEPPKQKREPPKEKKEPPKEKKEPPKEKMEPPKQKQKRESPRRSTFSELKRNVAVSAVREAPYVVESLFGAGLKAYRGQTPDWENVLLQLQESAKSFFMTAGETLLRSESCPQIAQKITSAYDQYRERLIAMLPAHLQAIVRHLSLSELLEILKWLKDVCNGVMTITEFSRMVFQRIGRTIVSSYGYNYGAYIGGGIGAFFGIPGALVGAAIGGYLGQRTATAIWDKLTEPLDVLDNLMAYLKSLW